MMFYIIALGMEDLRFYIREGIFLDVAIKEAICKKVIVHL